MACNSPATATALLLGRGELLERTRQVTPGALRLLRTAGLVHRRREGRLGYYRLSDGDARVAMQASLAQLRTLVGLHPESTADDREEG